jgi:hypothetical protein
LALKAVDDAVVIDTFAIDAVPKTKEKAKTETNSKKKAEG